MPIRFRILALIALGTMINYVDRINISVAASEMMKATSWDEARFGLVFSAFLAGYTVFQYAGGSLSDRWSACKVVGIACIGFSLFTALTPIGAGVFGLLLTLRFTVGVFESVTFPSFSSLNSRWIPRREFARAQSVLLTGVFLGQIVAYPTTTWIMERFSWQTVFYVNAAVGMMWVAVWFWYARDRPSEHGGISDAEREMIEANVEPKEDGARASLWAILRCPPIVLTCASYMLYGFIVWLFIFWFPTYLLEARGLSTMQMGMVGMVPIAAGFFGLTGGGMLSDRLLKGGAHPRTARVRVPGTVIALSAPLLVAAVTVPSTSACIACFAGFYFLFSMGLPGYFSLPLELSPRFVGSIVGVLNTSANFAGLFGPMIAGFLIADTGRWELPFYLAAALAVVCGAIYALFVRTEPVDIEA